MRKEAYKHDYTGRCAPENYGNPRFGTFSVGIFQWIPKASGKGLKKSAVKFRVKGSVTEATMVYWTAKNMCARMDNGFKPTNKSATV